MGAFQRALKIRENFPDKDNWALNYRLPFLQKILSFSRKLCTWVFGVELGYYLSRLYCHDFTDVRDMFALFVLFAQLINVCTPPVTRKSNPTSSIDISHQQLKHGLVRTDDSMTFMEPRGPRQCPNLMLEPA